MYCVRITKETRWNQYHDINLPSAKLRPQPPPPPTVWRGAGRGDLINLLYEHGRKKFTQEVQALGFQISMGNNFSVPWKLMGTYFYFFECKETFSWNMLLHIL